MKYFSIIEDHSLASINETLVSHFGLPEIQKKFSVYAFNGDKDEIHIEFKGKEKYITFLCSKEKQTLIKNSKFVFKNLKAFFKLIHNLGFTQCSTGEIIEYIYKKNGIEVTISNNTFIGNILSFESDDLNVKKNIQNLLGKKHQLEERSEISKYTKKLEIPKRSLINKFNIIDESIVKYADSVGLDIRSLEGTLKSRIESFSNDYGYYEESFHNLTNKNLLDSEDSKIELDLNPVSIIVPSYNSEDTILQTLYSIESQNLKKGYLEKIEVIVVDDGSKTPVFSIIEGHLDAFTFNLNIIRLSKNKGLSTARNIGIKASSNDILIFLDSDIILSKNYIKEHVARSTVIPNAIFVSFKKNIERNEKINKITNIKKGVDVPSEYDDLRINRQIEEGKAGLVNADRSVYTEILADTNYFKDLGYGRRIGVFDLPSMVIGHNFCTRKSVLEDVGYFSDNFKGWGLEDAYFGAKAIANGNFIIPVISTGVYHINHLPRSGSEEKKKTEFEHNLKVYKQLINSEI